jgi:hypothetical protein
MSKTDQYYGNQQTGGLRGIIPKQKFKQQHCGDVNETIAMICGIIIRAKVWQKPARGMETGKTNNTATKAGIKYQIPIF